MIRAYADNVILRFIPRPTKTAGGLHIPDTAPPNRRGTREAVVVASGPGYYTRLGALIPNEVKPGETVLVDELAGQDYAMDISVPRHNKGAEFDAIGDERGQFRIVREQEIQCVVEAGLGSRMKERWR